MRESLHALCLDLLCRQGIQSKPIRSPVRLCNWLFRLFSRHSYSSRTQSFQENRLFIIQVLKPLVPLIGRLVACSARICVDTQTDRQTVTLATHARRGLTSTNTTIKVIAPTIAHKSCAVSVWANLIHELRVSLYSRKQLCQHCIDLCCFPLGFSLLLCRQTLCAHNSQCV